ncbi:hypothetical protein [Streptomyces sp. NPDC089919]|uniref:hypothetical protein n=1 Tax=Streptomyces sp. NPDC089919 TaxID=3155188 RepID=UPI003431A06D
MPYSHDKAALAECEELLAIPANYLRRMRRRNGRICLDAGALGQQQLQALLFDCFFSRGSEHPFDLRGARTFPDLLAYVGWVAPQPDRLVLRVRAAARVCSYLLPYIRTFQDGSFEVSGIPGLRLERVTSKGLLLHHLPTHGRIELRERTGEPSHQHMRDALEGEAQGNTSLGVPDVNPMQAWTKASLTQGESVMAHHWAPTATTALRSALLVRANLLWSSPRHRAHLTPARRSNADRCLRWATGLTVTELGSLLTNSAVRIPEARFSAPTSVAGIGLIQLDGGILELQGQTVP